MHMHIHVYIHISTHPPTHPPTHTHTHTPTHPHTHTLSLSIRCGDGHAYVVEVLGVCGLTGDGEGQPGGRGRAPARDWDTPWERRGKDKRVHSNEEGEKEKRS